MSHKEKKAYLSAIRKRYRKANKELKSKILDEFCAVCEYHRKYAINLLSQPFRRKRPKPKKRGSRSIYNHSHIVKPLTKIWLATNQMCSKKLKVALPIWLPFYEFEYGQLSGDTKSKLLVMSAPTIDRLLKPNKAKFKRKGLCGTKPGSLLKNQIPIRTDNWDITKPGFCEADTVAHCGNSLSGDFAWSLTMTDIYSAWTENRATWGKGSQGVLNRSRILKKHCPLSY